MDVKWSPGALATRHLAFLAVLVLTLLGFAVMSRVTADAATQATPAWLVEPVAQPTRLQSGEADDEYEILLTNVGGAASSGTVTVTDTLPAGMTTSAQAHTEGEEEGAWECLPGTGQSVVTCTLLGPVAALGQAPTIVVPVTVAEGTANPAVGEVRVSGGGAPEVSAGTETPVNTVTPAFGVASFNAHVASADGMSDTRAADHPNGLTTTIDLNSAVREDPEGHVKPTSVQDVKDVVLDLPLGFLASALAAPTCTFAQLASFERCPPDTQIGHLLSEPAGIAARVNGPLYNMVPERGFAAEFGFNDALGGTHAIYASVVPTPGGYLLRIAVREIPQITLTDLVATIYGDPASEDEGGESPLAMFTNPSACTGESLVTSVHVDSWQEPGRFNPDGTLDLQDPRWVSQTSQSPPVSGCNELRFQPEVFSVKPDTAAAETPTGLHLDLKIAQSERPGTLATPPLRHVRLTLPAGLTVDPSLAGGLRACSAAQVGWKGGGSASFTAEPVTCPDASKIGTVELTTPLLGRVLDGSIYLAAQNENPFHSLLAAYIVVDDPTTGVVVKIPGDLTPNPLTGQITASFDQIPQLPISELKIRLFGGARGDLATPEGCATYTTTSDLEPWSAPESGPDATPSDSFPIDSGCISGFAPAFSAGTVNPQAGAYSPFTLSFSRNDSDEGLAGLTAVLPRGLLAKLAGVGECSDAQIAAAEGASGTAEHSAASCPASSLLGSATAAVGPGALPYSIAGIAYLTGPYKGAPYGLAIVVPALAGPFDLGTIVIRQALYVAPNDAHITDVSDPLPSIRDGIPLRIKRVVLTLDRPGFTVNPTSCAPSAVTATATSATGAQAPLSSRFQAADCAGLGFTPKVSAATGARPSKANGASLRFTLSYPMGAQGSQAWLNEAKLDLPRQLATRLTTVQMACRAGVFEANPAACPAPSVIGQAIVHTPMLPAPLVGPVYFVSHGGARFPEAVIVLQGDGVTMDMHGQTLIDHDTGITSATFAGLPDVPVESVEVSLPAGRYSEFGANLPARAKGSFCGQRLLMPTFLKAQNGLQIHRQTPIAVAGCTKVKARTRAQRLAAVLKACRAKRAGRRTGCERAARRRYRARAPRAPATKR